MSTSPTTRKQKQGRLPFDEKLFEQAALSTDEGAGYVAVCLEKVVYSDKFDQLLEYLLSKPSLFEYIYSVIDDSVASVIQQKLTDGFKFESEPMSVAASTIFMLERMAGFLYFRLADSTDAGTKFLLEHCKDICNNSDEMRVLRSSCGLYTPQPGNSKQAPRQAPSGKRKNSRRMTVTEDGFGSVSMGLSRQLLEKYRTRLEEMLKILRAERYSNKIRNIFEDDMTRQSPISIRGRIETNTSLPSETDLISPIAETSKAYLSVQPLKASLYLANAKGLGQWRIFLSTRAISDLRSYSKSKETFRIIIKKIQELSNGDFSDNNQKRLQGNGDGVPIFRAKLTNDLRLIYQIDCISDFNGLESQVLRIFGVFTLKQMDNRMWSSLSTVLSNKGRGYNKRVNYRRNSGNNHFLLPQSWQIANETEYGDRAPYTPLTKEVGDFQSVHHWLVLEKYSVLSQEILDCIKSGKEAMPVFAVSPYERDIIDHPSSCYVLGRSGTGKTTTMLFKILGIERAASMIEQRPRQLFVTRSHVLTSRVKNYFMKMKATYDTNTEYRPQADSTGGNVHLGDVDNEEEDKDLPRRFSELTDDHFPLFLTFDTLCTLIEADLDIMSNHPAGPNRRSRQQNKSPASDSQNVTFEVFYKDYWSHFPLELTRRLTPVSIFNEIIGVIKGSEPTLDTDKCYLSQQSYLALSERAQPMFSGQRDLVYEIFLKYQEKKRMYGDYDDADRTHTILRGMNNRDKELFQSIDYLFVDETQDNLAIDAFLLRQLCRNPHGLFWAGDTAQTILMGSSFRFADLKASLYRFERVLYPYISEKMIVDPKFFQLTTNYRSHDGIVSCADTITQMLSYFWPESIDVLRREEGLVAGMSPIFFEGWEDGTSQFSKFLFENGNSQIEIGAKQCVLVRDKQARDKLYNQIGKKSELIMTLYDSKGLEFDDVLLYNFLEDSPYDELHWKVVLNFLKDKYDSEIHAPHFDKVYHSGICTELKLFYVAITRARESVWIIDGSDKGGPMKDLLLGTKSVTTCQPEDAPPLKSTSSKEDWASSGTMYFNNHKYSQAAYCFNRAGMTYEYEVANAYHLRIEAGRLTRDSKRSQRTDAYVSAAEAFHKSAGDSDSHERSRMYYRISAECYQEAQRFIEAAEGYREAEEYLESVYSFMDGGEYDKVVDILRTRADELDPMVVDIKKECISHYIESGRTQCAIRIFDSEESFFTFLKDNNLNTECARALEGLGRFDEAAEIYLSKRKIEQAISLFLQGKSWNRAGEHLLSRLWRRYGFGVPIDRDLGNKGLWEHLGKLLEYTNFLETNIKNELYMFELIKNRDLPRLRSHYKQHPSNISAHVLVLDKILRVKQDTSIDELAEHVSACCTYSKVLRRLWHEKELPADLHLQKLLVFHINKDGKYCVSNDSPMFTNIESSTILGRTEEGVIIRQPALKEVIRKTIEKRLRSTVESHEYLIYSPHHDILKQPYVCSTSPGINPDSINSDWLAKQFKIRLLRMMYWNLAEFSLVDSPLEWHGRIQEFLVKDYFMFLHSVLLCLKSMNNPSLEHILHELDEGMSLIHLRPEGQVARTSYMHINIYRLIDAFMDTSVIELYHDTVQIRGLIRRLCFYTFGVWDPCYSGDQACSAVKALFDFLEMKELNTIGQGCRFINCALRKGLKIKVEYLCHIFQLLCGTAALVNKRRLVFHGCLLPRSWIAYILPRIRLGAQKWFENDAKKILNHCESLIVLVLGQMQDETIFYETTSEISRMKYIQTLISSICFLGYNSHPKLRDDILDMLWRIKPQLPSNNNANLLLPYFIESWSWPELLPEAKKPFQSQSEELVQLCRKNGDSSSLCEDSSVTSITYKNVDELYQLFPLYNLSPSVPTTISQPVKMEKKTEEENTGNTEEEINASLEQEGEKGTEIVSDDLQPENDSEQKEMQVIRLVLCFLGDVEKDKAAFTLQKAYKTLYKRKKEVNSCGFQKLMNSYTRCTVSASNKTWSIRKRRFMYLGMVPHILVCIDVLLEKVVDEKKKWNKLLKNGNTSIDEGELMRRADDAINTRKRLDRIKREFGDGFEWFESCGADELGDRIGEVSELIDKFQINEVQQDIQLALKMVINACIPT